MSTHCVESNTMQSDVPTLWWSMQNRVITKHMLSRMNGLQARASRSSGLCVTVYAYMHAHLRCGGSKAKYVWQCLCYLRTHTECTNAMHCAEGQQCTTPKPRCRHACQTNMKRNGETWLGLRCNVRQCWRDLPSDDQQTIPHDAKARVENSIANQARNTT